MKKILFILCAFFCGYDATAQIVLQKGEKSIAVGEPASEEKVVSLFGQPSRTWTAEGKAVDGFMITYSYDKLRISVVNGFLWDFAVGEPGYEIVIHNRYRLKVGDSYSAFISSIPQSEVDIRQLDEDSVKMYFKIKDSDVFSDDSLVLTCKQGKIVLISWFVPV